MLGVPCFLEHSLEVHLASGDRASICSGNRRVPQDRATGFSYFFRNGRDASELKGHREKFGFDAWDLVGCCVIRVLRLQLPARLSISLVRTGKATRSPSYLQLDLFVDSRVVLPEIGREDSLGATVREVRDVSHLNS